MNGEQKLLKDELIHKRANSFDWEKYKQGPSMVAINWIMESPHPCDYCGDIYNKNDLIGILSPLLSRRETSVYCKNCLEHEL